MENEKVQVDEKTAKMLEEMDKSLKNMEQTLGMDHPVIAKLLDSYAKLLRQNNIRHLDALNMEARAKAIRAKENKEKAQKQSEGLAETKQEKHMSSDQMRMVSFGIAGLLACGFLYGGYQMYQWFEHQKDKKVSHTFKGIQINRSKDGSAQDQEPQRTVESQTQLEQSQESNQDPNVSTSTEAETNEQGTVTSTTTTTTTRMNMMEMADKMKALKDFAKTKLADGQTAEQEKDYPKASALYFEVIQNVQNSAQTLGRPTFSEEIAQCYEGYGRMAELDAHPEIAEQCKQTAADVRAHIGN